VEQQHVQQQPQQQVRKEPFIEARAPRH
jgi:hypothetical protein